MVTPAAKVQFSLDTYVNTPLFQVLTPEFRLSAPARVQGLHLVWLGFFGVSVSERNTVLVQCPGTSA